MTDTSDQLETLFGKLDTQINNGQTKRALKTADEILKLAPSDSDAICSKVALLIDLGNINDAIKLIEAHPRLAEPLSFERAYCLYRQGKLQDSLSSLSSIPAERESARLQLEAQLRYRLGDYRQAITLYSKLFQEHKVNSKEIQTNVLAAYVAGGKASELPSVMNAMRVSNNDSFEIAFNIACGLVESDKLKEADDQLQLARRIGEEALYEEELEEDEIDTELAPITAQLAYIAQRSGRVNEAVQMYTNILDLAPEDAATASVAAVNSCAAILGGKADRKSAAEKLRKLEPFVERSLGMLKPKPNVEQRLGPHHCRVLLAAYATAAIVAGKSDVAKEAIRGLEKQYTGYVSLPLLHATLLAKEGKSKEAHAVLAAAAPGSSAAALLRVQLAAASGDINQALELLTDLPDPLASAPAVACTRAALLERADRPEEAAAALERVAHSGSGSSSSSPAAASWVTRRLAQLRLKAGDLQGAVDRLRQLVEMTPDVLNDAAVVSLYARLAALVDPSAASALLQQLPSVPGLMSDEIDALESAGVGAIGSRKRDKPEKESMGAASGQGGAGDEDGGEGRKEGGKNKKHKKRKPRLPKGLDPEKPGPLPDPERWLPKWQRADAKKARKKRKDKDQIKGSQGAGKVDASLDISNKPTPAASSGGDDQKSKGAAGGGKGGGGKSSKKKGRK